MKKSIINAFHLQGFLVDSMQIEEEQQKVFIKVRSPKRLRVCPGCGQKTKKVHQITFRQVKHGLLDQKVVVLVLKVRRFKCNQCGKVFTESFPGITRHKTSSNFRLQLLDHLRTNSFRHIGEKFNISPSSLVRCVLEFNGNIGEIDWQERKTGKLGIDEHSFRGKRMVITVTDLENQKLLAILKGDNQKTLEDFLVGIPKEVRDDIEEVCTDLRESYSAVIKKYLPRAKHVADRFHVEILARMMVDEIRRIIQEERPGRRMNTKRLLWVNKYELSEEEVKKLERIFQYYEQYPVLWQAWMIKEKLVAMYQTRNKEEAVRKFDQIIMLLETSDYSGYLQTFLKTLKRWREPILNYFNHRTTNGFTEGCHTKIKMIKRISYGFKNIENYIAKVTLAFMPLTLLVSYHTL